MDRNIFAEVVVKRLNKELVTASERIIREKPLTILINRKRYATAMIMAGMEEEFVLGHLFSQGMISGMDGLLRIEINESTAEVTLKKPADVSCKRRGFDSDLSVGPAEIFFCVEAILQSQVFKKTEAVHSAGIFFEGKKRVSIAEDIGRHNAMDKAIGAALLTGVDFKRTVAASTGRQPSEMLLKYINTGIPIIATKGAPTVMAVELAEKNGITIAGMVRKTGMYIYSNPWRIR